jgi:hypothetical protein
LQLPQGQFLKQAEQFEDDYDNNDYSDYIEDVSVHAVTDIKSGLGWPSILRRPRESLLLLLKTQSGCRMIV